MKSVKTAISIPENIYRDAADAAKKLGMTRSQLYSAAVADFLNRYKQDQIKARLDEVYAAGSTGLDPALAAMQLASLSKEEW